MTTVLILFLIFAIVTVLHALFVSWLAYLQNKLSNDIGLICFLVLLGLTGFLTFWIYYFSHITGVTFSVILSLLGIIIPVFAWRYNKWEAILVAHKTFLPISVYTFLILFIGYSSCSQLDNIESIAANRWLTFPLDNYIPKSFADQIWIGRISRPMISAWLSSDRPPLQAGLYLLLVPFRLGSWQDCLVYQVVCSMLQALSMFPIFLLVKKLNSYLAPWVLIGFGTTSLMVINTLYVWPKLLSLTYILIFYLTINTRFGDKLSRKEWVFFSASSASLAMLSHGGAFFALIPISVLYIIRCRLLGVLLGFPAALLSLLIFAPWVLYQKIVDPPGNFLLKWHLAGMMQPNALTLSQAIRIAYKNITIQMWINGRVANLEKIFFGTIDFFNDLFQTVLHPLVIFQQPAPSPIIERSFFEMFYSLGCFSPVLALFLWGGIQCWWKQKIRVPESFMWLSASAILSLVLWSLLMFIPGSTIIHQGSYFSWVALFICSSLVLWRSSKWFFYLALLVNGGIFLHFYVMDIFWKSYDVRKLGYVLCASFIFILFMRAVVRLRNVL